MHTTDTELEAIKAEAAKLGTEAGEAAASWVFDGNSTQAAYLKILTGIIEGDPLVLDSLAEPNLSGEWGDETTPGTLADELGLAEDDLAVDDACEAWEQAARDAFWAGVELAAREALDMPTSGRRYLVAYFTEGYGGTDPRRFATLADARDAFRRWVYREAGPYATADLYYAAGDENWLEALKYVGTGCPFDGIDYRLEVGPRGGITTERG
jgi:hypothetical protein